MTRENALYRLWCENAAEDPDLVKELTEIRDDADAIRERFYKDLSFGTAGLRGKVGAGTNRMNIYTVGKATQGIADYTNRYWYTAYYNAYIKGNPLAETMLEMTKLPTK